MTARYDTITFLSDYGYADEFVGVVKSVIRSIAPDVTVIDLTHDIEPHDVRGAGLTLASGNTIQRVDVKNASGVGVTGSAITTLTYGANSTISAISGIAMVSSTSRVSSISARGALA